MTRRNQSDAEGWAPPGGPWPVTESQTRGVQAPTAQDLHWQPVDRPVQAPAADPWDTVLNSPMRAPAAEPWEDRRPDERYVNGQRPASAARNGLPTNGHALGLPDPISDGGYSNGQAVRNAPSTNDVYPTAQTRRLPASPTEAGHTNGHAPRLAASPSEINGANGHAPRLPASPSDANFANGRATRLPASPSETNYNNGETSRLPASPSEGNRANGHAPRLPASPSEASYANGNAPRLPASPSEANYANGRTARLSPAPSEVGYANGHTARLSPTEADYGNGYTARLSSSSDAGYTNGYSARLSQSEDDSNRYTARPSSSPSEAGYANGQVGRAPDDWSGNGQALRLPEPTTNYANGQSHRPPTDRGYPNGEPVRPTAPAPDRDHINGQSTRLPAPDRGHPGGQPIRSSAPAPDYDDIQTHRLPAAMAEPVSNSGHQTHRSTPAIEKVYDTGQSRRNPVSELEESYDSAADEPAAPAAEQPYDTGAHRQVVEVTERLYDTGQSRRRAAAEEEAYETGTVRRRPHASEEDESYESRSRRRSGRVRVEVPPIVNPYSIVALVGALLGLFPVAIVFGLISFGHPRGRIMALFAMMMGVAEVMVVGGLLVMSGFTVPHNPFHTQAASDTTTVAPATQSAALAPSTAPVTAAPVTTTPTAASSSAPVGVVQGETCTAAQAALIGTAADSSTLLCLQGNGGYRWTGPYNVSTAVYTNGTACTPATDKSARTSDGRALVCQGSGHSAVWTLWTS
ncbi:hypothetical protein KO481_00375 [Nocardia sp. NEAU-G5]|uniref:DUF4190 domain-containing protein n=1 Tax=Nocardia albiluteola TaxID=2842303 RepID=A0ABS6APP3_9NOCA|nr:hypothetical protein [Nocardia albiluteola]MBU3059989.1 hypothetical protein [Nocardia albiluteola]